MIYACPIAAPTNERCLFVCVMRDTALKSTCTSAYVRCACVDMQRRASPWCLSLKISSSFCLYEHFNTQQYQELHTLSMAILGMNSSLLACALALVISGSDAFSPGAKHFAIVTKVGPRVRTPFFMAEEDNEQSTPFFMAEESNEQITITSGKKEIAYDEKAGRFFETSLE